MALAAVRMPKLGESVTEGTVDRWLKGVGDLVGQDEPLLEIVTDKVNAEVPSPVAGRLARIDVAEGVTVPVGTELAQIEVESGMVADTSPNPPADETVETAGPLARTAAQPDEAQGASTGPGRYSPAVRRLAESHGLTLEEIPGTGSGGRLSKEDVLSWLEGRGRARGEAVEPEDPFSTQLDLRAPAEQEVPAQAPSQPASARELGGDGREDPGEREELVPITATRRAIGEHMSRSLATAPHAWMLQEVDVTDMVRRRDAEKEAFLARHGAPLGHLAVIAHAVVQALGEIPLLNSSWTDAGILVKHYVNLGIAVAGPDGLVVPVVHGADVLDLPALAGAIADVVTRARERRLTPPDVRGGTFTLNNTGALGSIASQPIINQPQAAILTTEAIVRRPAVHDGGIAIRHIMNICLSIDHRIVDGALAAAFLGSIKTRLESGSDAVGKPA